MRSLLIAVIAAAAVAMPNHATQAGDCCGAQVERPHWLRGAQYYRHGHYYLVRVGRYRRERMAPPAVHHRVEAPVTPIERAHSDRSHGHRPYQAPSNFAR
jgi:hypothetical protein